LISCVAKKTDTSARDTSDTASSPKARASSFRPSAIEVAVPARTTSSAFSGAG
jgi:hypothetical protein